MFKQKGKSTVRLILSQAGFRRYAANTAWLVAEQALRVLAGLFVGIWVARYLGPNRFGLFSYALAFAAIFGGIAKLGLDQIVIRDLIEQPEREPELLGTTFWLKAIGGAACLIVVAIIAVFSQEDARTVAYIVIITAGVLFQPFEVISFHFQARVLSKFVSICKAVQLAVSSIVKIGLILLQADLLWFVVVTMLDQVTLGAALHVAFARRGRTPFYRTFRLELATRLLRDSWPMALSGIVIVIYSRVDQLMVRSLLGDRELGIYSAAVKLSESIYFIPMVIVSSLLPAVINGKKVSPAVYHGRLQQLYTLNVWTAIAIAAPVSLLSGPLVNLLYGRAYAEASGVLRIHIWASVFVFLGVASSSWFTSENLQRLALYRTAAGAVANLAMNAALIPAYGARGAAYAAIAGQLVAAFAFDVFTKETRRVFSLKLNAFIPTALIERK